MAPLRILSKLNLVLMAAGSLALAGNGDSVRAQAPPPPLMVPYGPLLKATEGWHQEGELLTHAMGAAGDDAWLTASWSADRANPGAGSFGKVLLRIVRRNAPPFPPLPVANAASLTDSVKVIPGQGGAWAVWQSGEGLKAWWISAVTGRELGPPLLLPHSNSFREFEVAGDGETGWVVWDSFSGLQVATLTVAAGTPQLRGKTVLFSSLVTYGSGSIAAANGRLMVVRRSGSPGAPGPVVSRLINADAVGGTEHVWTASGPTFNDSFYGVISYGNGWMAVWSRTLTPLVAGNIVYGQELDAAGRPLPDQAAEPLFIEPSTGYNPWYGVTSHAGKGAVFSAKRFYEDDGRVTSEGLAMILTPAEPRRVLGQFGILELGMANSNGHQPIPLPPLAASLRGNVLDLMTSDGLPREYFQHTIIRYDITSGGFGRRLFQVDATYASGLQEEPAIAWTPTAAVLAWQQKSTTLAGPEIRLRSYFANSIAPDLILTSYDDSPASSPDLAANGNRVLIVARQEYLDDDSGLLDDLTGVITENAVPVTAVFKIGYGAGSQRAGCAAAFGEGYCVVWREELNRATPDYVSRIRAVVLDRNGVPDVPGGYSLASSSDELSAPALAVNGQQFCVVWKRHVATGTHVEASTVTYFTHNGSHQRSLALSIFPDSLTTSSPDIAVAAGGYVITARSDKSGRPNEIVAAFLSTFPAPIPITPPPGGLPEGREPALADLGGGRTALFWLNHLKRNHSSTQIWMAVSPGGGQAFNQAAIIQTGVFDRDTLAVEGDGLGRVLVAVKSRDPGDEGVRFYQLAAGVTSVPEFTLTTAAGLSSNDPTMIGIRWNTNLLFPPSSHTVQTSTDLGTWITAPGQLVIPPLNGSPAAFFRAPVSSPGPRFYRLRAAFSAE